jgi:hypothetical protein
MRLRLHHDQISLKFRLTADAGPQKNSGGSICRAEQVGFSKIITTSRRDKEYDAHINRSDIKTNIRKTEWMLGVGRL